MGDLYDKMKKEVPISNLNDEEQYIVEAVKAAGQIQTFLWGLAHDNWGLEEWKRMFRKRICKIDDIDESNPHASVEMKKRLLQNAALSIALINIIDKRGMPTEDKEDIPTNLPECFKPYEKQEDAQKYVEKSPKEGDWICNLKNPYNVDYTISPGDDPNYKGAFSKNG